MFGRRRDEDYDAYNERYSAKYDDDYIAPSEEYRSECDHSHEQSYDDITDVRECDHSHEQTYEDITDVRECDHTHEQTYNDADKEQRPYDNYVSLESRFEQVLMPNEHLLWTGGKYDPNKKAKNQSASAGGVMLVLSIILMCTVVLAVIGVIMLIFSVILLSGATAGVYGITDKRVIIINSSGQTSVPLENIRRVNAFSGSNGKGYITLNLTKPLNGSSKNNNVVGMYNISDAKRVERILNDAIHGALMNK
jgi:hypothetical protein